MGEARNVVVTGGGTGIGLATTQVLVERGWQVTAAGLEREDGFPDAARFVECDVTDAASLARVFEGLETLGGLVTCAGTIQYGREWEEAVFEKVMAVNVTGVLSSCTAARDALQRGGGAVVNIASMWSWFGNPVAPAYGTSKGAVVALTRSLAVAWGASGIRVNAVAPGWVETRISEGARADAARRARIDARIPIGRWAATVEIARVVAFLLSEDASYIHGAIVPVDGGYLAA
ncbi:MULTISPECIES: SDR family oxidoreductase [unclassified Shinella]|uniref:SDR family NAD(P)-dependent oxidoreductase n=1 Tax=unclassified Shinella TaxID=2643062 RepID=UPI00225DA317|nr:MULTISPECIES: SDR family oxidoreductase [unclassified Shinella]MCO5138587.1 SDR family oxidoreductase [Shinella sp.]MDC7255425.1 SDR family oxidoreductase [Shinella sp. YE25]CAI0338209.1 NAD(P)-dependent dehydrogenase (Short-subunit alcohol dehydrogenase family) [Rhizobiaceae bacterium]CAK7256662.1 NAD(P)-dependent dehydrogenase (Short-subunit alcohol dehydrogenase family) [Shinella sp. WSC3-e]